MSLAELEILDAPVEQEDDIGQNSRHASCYACYPPLSGPVKSFCGFWCEDPLSHRWVSLPNCVVCEEFMAANAGCPWCGGGS